MKLTKSNKSIIFAIIIAIVVILGCRKCGFIRLIYYNNKSIIEKKYIYFNKNGRLEGAWNVNSCSDINKMNLYYNLKDTSIDFSSGYIQPNEIREVIDYNYSDSSAVIRVYNHSPHLQEVGFVYVSMKCLHNSPWQTR